MQVSWQSTAADLVCCRYFAPGPRLAKEVIPLAGTKLYCLVTETGVSSLPKATTQWCPASRDSNRRPVNRKSVALPRTVAVVAITKSRHRTVTEEVK